MESRAHALMAGLFTVILLAAMIATALWFKGDSGERVPYVLVSESSVSGLNVQASVRLRGVEVGKVTDIRFDSKNPRRILVTILVDRGTPITKGTFAELASQGVTGLAYVQLDEGPSYSAQLATSAHAPAQIELRPSFFERVSSSGQDLLEGGTEVTRRLNQLLDDKNQQQLLRTLGQIEAASARVTALSDRIEPSLKGLPALMTDTGITLKRADALMTNLNELAVQATKRVDAVDRVATAAQQMGAAAQQLGDAGDALRQNLSGETLPRVDALLESAARSTRSIERLTDELNEQPASVLFGRAPVPPGPGEPGFAPPRSGVKP